ncbi:unnamed protein product [Ilex paraguariensis]|uniref:Ferulate-5-hydroxylase n=1 Tax=Ilex paraguariensis TaxID=185542 RepID=A0ABC8TFC6_9AQUA
MFAVFSRRRAESWASVREEIDSAIRTIAGQVGSPVNIGELVFGLTKNITYRSAFGSMSNEGQDEFIKILQEFSKLFGAFNIADFIPSLGWIQGGEFNKRLANARNSLDGFIDKIIDEHMEKKKNNSDANDTEIDTDMVDELLAFYSEDDLKNDSEDSLKVTRDNIKALIMV